MDSQIKKKIRSEEQNVGEQNVGEQNVVQQQNTVDPYCNQIEESKNQPMNQQSVENDNDDDEVPLEEGEVDENFNQKVQRMLYGTDNGLNLQNKPKMPLIYYEFNEEIRLQAQQEIEQDQSLLPEQLYQKYETEASKCWDKFYRWHQNNFFKDRHYLEREIPELNQFQEAFQKEKKQFIFCEMGCGVGNTIFPITKNYNFFSRVEGFDFSKRAIEVLKQSEHFKPEEMDACVCDLVLDPLPDFQRPDLATLIFVLSAISPEKHQLVAQKIYDWMKPGSVLYFRDYGKYDFGQINLSRKKNRKLKDNFYVKNDGVRVYYFENEVNFQIKQYLMKEVSQLFQKVGFKQLSLRAFYRYIENRKTKLKMYRVWVQGRFLR